MSVLTHHPLRPDYTQDTNNTVVKQYVNYWIMKSIELQNTRCSLCTNFSLLVIDHLHVMAKEFNYCKLPVTSYLVAVVEFNGEQLS